MNFLSRYNIQIKIALIITFTLITAVLWYYFRIFQLFLNPHPVLLFPLIIYSTLVFIYLPIRVILYVLYKSYPDTGYRPSVSIIVPAYNEGLNIKNTLISLLRADYPRKQIIVVDDGSADDTYKHIKHTQKMFPGRIEAYRFMRNRGKREAMALGVEHSRGEIVVFVDSDTSIEKNALKYLIAPFSDSDVGGVTGKVKVKNRDTNILTRMLAVRYVMSFDFYRCTRSSYGGVMCLSGVISAYRLSLLKKVIPAWLNQQFLGNKCTFGDDRSLTNHTIMEGYKTVYSRKAVAYTMVPETMPKLLRMLARWNRSFIRESIVLGRFLTRNGNLKRRKMLFFDFTITSLMAVFIIFVLGFMFLRILENFSLSLNFVGSISLMSMIYMSFYINTEKDWHFVYGILYSFLYMFLLIWMLPYAMLTLKRNIWGTR